MTRDAGTINAKISLLSTLNQQELSEPYPLPRVAPSDIETIINGTPKEGTGLFVAGYRYL